MKKIFFYIFIFLIMSFLIVSCIKPKQSETEYIDISDSGEIVIENIDITLDSNITREISAEDPTKFEYNILYLARIMPVKVNTKTGEKIVQANDIVINDDKAIIAYNSAGDDFVGAVQIVDISKPDDPSIIKEIRFNEIEVNSVFYNKDTNEIIFGGGVNPDIFEGKRSFISKFNLNNINTDDILNNIKYLKSYTTTSIEYYDNKYFVSVGALNGGIEILNSSLEELDFLSSKDIRDIDAYSLGVITLNATSIAENGSLKNIVNGKEYNIGSFYSPERKATIQLKEFEEKIFNEDAIAFLGLGQEGFKILRIMDTTTPSTLLMYSKTLLELVPNSTEIETSVNSVSYDGGFIFIALGEYGFKIFRLNGLDIDSENGENYYNQETFSDLVGKHIFSQEIYGTLDDYNFSFNHIAYKKRIQNDKEINYLFAAAGNYGVNIYRFMHKNQYSFKNIDNSLLENIFDGKNLDTSKFIENDFSIKLKKDTQMTVSFIKANNGHKHEFGFVEYNSTTNATTNEKELVFENTSKQGAGGSLDTGYSKIYDSTFAASGTEFVFYLKQNGFNKPDGNIYYSDRRLNEINNNKDDKVENHYSYFFDETNNKLFIALATLNKKGKSDFNDLIIMIDFLPETQSINEIVEVINLP